MVVDYTAKIKEILNGVDIIELDDNQIRQNGIFLVFDGIKTKDLKSSYFFSIYIASNTLNRDNSSIYPQIDEIFRKFKNYLIKCNKLNLGVLTSFDIGKKLKVYKLEVNFEE